MNEKPITDVLQVRTFGTFSMTWNGTAISGGNRASESQFSFLMQMLLHHRKEGVSREILEECLFEDRDLENVHHALRSVIYNAKQKLKSCGLPEVSYIEQKKGVYYWTGEIPVNEDAEEVEALVTAADAEKDLDIRLGLYQDAIHLYKGDFLARQTGVIWIAQEARRYRSMFCHAVEAAVSILRAYQDYMQMEEIGRYASKIYPLSNWETVTMEALIQLGRYEEARKLYEDTVEFYLKEQGLRPSNRLMELFSELGSKMEYDYAVLDQIQKELNDCGTQTGGYVCSYPIFQGIYHMVQRITERGGQSVYLMLCTIVDSKGNPMREGPALDELAQRLGDAIRKSVRQSDAINHYGKGQYLVLLVNTTRENCGVVQKRINYNFIVGRQRTGIQYYVNSVISSGAEAQKLMDSTGRWQGDKKNV